MVLSGTMLGEKTQKKVVGWVGPVLFGHGATEDLLIPRDAFVRPPQCMLPCHPSLPSLSWHLTMCRLLGLGGQRGFAGIF